MGPVDTVDTGDNASARRTSLGWPARTTCAAGVGLLLCSVANALARGTETTTTGLYWLGLLLITLPIFYRLSSRQATPAERLFHVCLLGLSLYGVKAVRDSLLFTFPDEFVHAFNASQIVNHHQLFEPNPGIPITPRFPGLEGATSALMTLGGASPYVAGTVLVAAAKLTLVLALFLLFGRISGSVMIAGLGVAIYTATPNFLFFDAQFSYESLSLPLFAAVLALLVEREADRDSRAPAWAAAICIVIAAIVPTHHLTSYALAIVLAALAVAYRVVGVRRRNPWPFAVFAFVLALVWLFTVAHSTIDYLGPVLGDAVKGTFETAAGGGGRGLFESAASTAPATPILARAVSLIAVAILAVGVGFGLLTIWRRHRRQPFHIVFGIAAAGFFVTLVLRFAPAAWETGNRAGEFLFFGVALVASYGGLRLLASRRVARSGRHLLAGLIALAMVGGVISGWPWDQQMAHPIRVRAEGREIVSESLAAANWASRHLSSTRVAAPEADARLFLAPGEVESYGGKRPDVFDITASPELESWQLPLLQKYDLPYILVDRRRISSDTARGQYFQQGEEELFEPDVLHKFAKIPVGRIYTSGNISIFDLHDRP